MSLRLDQLRRILSAIGILQSPITNRQSCNLCLSPPSFGSVDVWVCVNSKRTPWCRVAAWHRHHRHPGWSPGTRSVFPDTGKTRRCGPAGAHEAPALPRPQRPVVSLRQGRNEIIELDRLEAGTSVDGRAAGARQPHNLNSLAFRMLCH